LFNPKHDLDNAPFFCFDLLKFQLQADHYSITPTFYV
jgi:hypothetical protein